MASLTLLCFTQLVSEFIEIEARLLLTFFTCLHNKLISMLSIVTKEYRCLKNFIHQIDKKMNGCFFQQVLRQNLKWFLPRDRETFFLKYFILTSTEIEYVLLKKVPGILKIAFPLRDRHVFM